MSKNSKNKGFKLLIVLLISAFALTTNVSAATFNVCNKSGFMKAFQIVSVLLQIIRIVVPIILIIMGSVDFGKASISNDNDALKSAGITLAKRAIAAVIVFFIPIVIWFVLDLADKADEMKDFNCITVCIKNHKNCVIPKDGGVFGGSK